MRIDYLPKTDIRTIQVKTAAVFDLDGTLRYSKAGKFITKPEDITLFDGVEEKLWQLRDGGNLILAISNQGGVAFNIKTPHQEMAEIDYTLSLFKRNPFHLVKTCWHHEKGRDPVFGHRSLFRKPDIGMLAMCEFECFEAGFVIDWNHSLFVGDRPEDQECAKRAGIPEFYWAWEFFGRERPVEDAR